MNCIGHVAKRRGLKQKGDKSMADGVGLVAAYERWFLSYQRIIQRRRLFGTLTACIYINPQISRACTIALPCLSISGCMHTANYSARKRSCGWHDYSLVCRSSFACSFSSKSCYQEPDGDTVFIIRTPLLVKP